DAVLTSARMSSATGDSSKSLFLCEIAKAAAAQLEDDRLLATALYRIGRAHFDQGNTKAAREQYLLSKQTFEEVNSPRDLIYLLAELGSLEIYDADYLKGEDYSRKSLALAESVDASDELPGGLPKQYGVALAW